MKVLMLTPWFPSNENDQAGNYILDAVNEILSLGHEVFILHTYPYRPKFKNLKSNNNLDSSSFLNQYQYQYCRYLSIPRSYLNFISHTIYRKLVFRYLQKIYNNFKFDVIHAHTEIAGVAAADFASVYHIPTVMTIHGISTEKKLYRGHARKTLFEYTLNSIDRVILVGKPLLSFINQFTEYTDHCRIVPNGFRRISDKIDIKKTILEHQNINFISVSNLVEGKGIDINLCALQLISEQGITNWHYHVVGDGAEKKNLIQLANKLGIIHKVSFHGALSHIDVYKMLSKADIFSLPSYREAFGIAYLEAMACGLLTIGVNGQGPSTFINNNQSGFLCKPNDATALADIFLDIIHHKNKAKQIAMTGMEYIHEHFGIDKHANKLISVYQEAMSR